MGRQVSILLFVAVATLMLAVPENVAAKPGGVSAACRQGDLAMKYGMVNSVPVGFDKVGKCVRVAAHGGAVLTSTFTVIPVGVDPNGWYWYRYVGAGLMPGATVNTVGTKFGPPVAADGTVNFLNAYISATPLCNSNTQLVGFGFGSTTTAGGAEIEVHFDIPDLPCAYLDAPPE
jgi:hypothetical protein